MTCRARFALLFAGALALAGGAGACSGSDAVACHSGADCASGACTAQGQCVPVGASGGPASGSGDDAGSLAETGASTDRDAASSAAGDGAATGACAPNHDGVIDRAEVPLAAGLRATFRTARDVDVDTAGKKMTDGTRRWDWSGALAGDHDLLIETIDPAGQWFSADFAGATYVARLSDSSDLLGVFQLDASSLSLRGVVSPTSGVSQTKVTDAPAVASLAFPLQAGKSWTSHATVSGQASGVYAYYTEDYASSVDATGELATPLGSFQVLRVATTLTRTVGGFPTTTRSFAFVSECYGVVAHVVSNDNETQAEFTHAAEIQRIAP